MWSNMDRVALTSWVSSSRANPCHAGVTFVPCHAGVTFVPCHAGVTFVHLVRGSPCQSVLVRLRSACPPQAGSSISSIIKKVEKMLHNEDQSRTENSGYFARRLANVPISPPTETQSICQNPAFLLEIPVFYMKMRTKTQKNRSLFEQNRAFLRSFKQK